jgi:hypothetical protein
MAAGIDAALPHARRFRRSVVWPFRRLDGSIAAASDNLAPFANKTAGELSSSAH